MVHAIVGTCLVYYERKYDISVVLIVNKNLTHINFIVNSRLCGQGFVLLGPSKIICDDCRKPVCSKCSIELHLKNGPK